MVRSIHSWAVAVVGIVLAACAIGATKFENLKPGLIATYSGGGRTVTRIVATPNFTLAANESVHPRIPAEFTAVYEGVIRILAEGQYAFSSDGGSGTKILVDGTPADNGVRLAPGDHAIRVEYIRRPGPARLQLLWASPGKFPTEPVPPSVFGHANTLRAPIDSATTDRGRLLVRELNCVACHTAGDLTGRPGPDLTGIGARAKSGWIERWLAAPRHFRKAAAMPLVLREEKDRRDVAAYLATLKAGEESRKVESTEETIKAGRETFESVGCVNCHGVTGVDLSGTASKWSAAAALSKYLQDPLAVDRSGRMPSMMLDEKAADAVATFLMRDGKVEGKGIGGGEYTFTARRAEYEREIARGDAARGKEIFAAAGCVNCHAGGAENPAAKKSVDLTKADPSRGCLLEHPGPGVPDYTLAADERAAVAAYVQAISREPELAPAPAHAYEEHVRAFNCLACHTTGIVAAGAQHVAMDGVPPLIIAGQKLRPEWIRRVLLDKGRARPWNKLRMPHFGPAIEPVATALVAVSGAGPIPETHPGTAQTIGAGRRIVGKGADGSLSCITCHSFDGNPVAAPEQSRGPELVRMAARLRPEWFKRWVREPTRIVPNTVMPSFFTGKKPEDADAVIDHVWDYLSLGREMPAPEGLASETNVRFDLVPTEAPLVQRCYLDGGSGDGKYNSIPRAVAVGLPGLFSYAFDPDTCQICFAWAGGFVDMTKGWTNRGDTHGRRVGRVTWTAGRGPALFVDSLGKLPTRIYRGYEFRHGRAELIYEVEGITVREWLAPTADGAGIVRTFELDPAGRDIFFVVADDPRVEVTGTPGTFEPVETPPGWEWKTKTKAITASGRGVGRFSYVIRPAAAGEGSNK